MKNLIILIISIVLTGCVSLEISNENEKKGSPYLPTTKQSILNKIKTGMSIKEVQKIFNSNETIIGYKKNSSTKTFEKIIIKNPYRSQFICNGNNRYLINYYFIGVKKPDGIISEEELIPVIFKDKIVIGKGQDYLFNLKHQ